ncbi:restriction endonuclease [Dactylosporangium sp. NPDC000555]|uniref:restriction endonuclease n=1 Tax=Dactylosporangium sp. NPDC000555 TaxID=3154260 RepID=UPI003318BD99
MAARVRNQPWAPCATNANLRTPPTPGGPGNCPPGGDLDLHVGWDRFEKLMLDLVQRVLGLRGVRFRRYGTLGQKQHGIDLAGRDPDGAYVVVQCKDYRSFTKADLRRAVATFASGRRPFHATHLIVATSANTEPTQVFDELATLQGEHPELTLDLWGAEQINDYLRRNADIVARFWTRETAATFCTAAPLPGVPAPPPDRQLQAARILVGPLKTSDVLATLRQAEEKRVGTPHESAVLYRELAEQLEAAGHRGHAAVMRDRQTGALREAGQSAEAAAVIARLAVNALNRGERDEARRLKHMLTEVVNETNASADSEPAEPRRHAALVAAAVDYVGDPLGRPDDLLRALSDPDATTVPYHPELVLVLAEGVAAGLPHQLGELDPLLRSTIGQLGAAGSEEIGIRLRLVLAEYDHEERRVLGSVARKHELPGRLAALVSAREARRCAQESRLDEAVEHWRDAVLYGIHDGLADDAADWLYAIRSARHLLGPLVAGIDDEHHLAQALRHTASDRLLNRAQRPSERARAAVLDDRPRVAVLHARQWLTDAFITGSWAVELEAARFLGDLYRDNEEPEAAAELFARSGSAKKIEELAEQVGDRLIPVTLDREEPWWTTSARIVLTIAQADLLPDKAAAALLEELTDLAARGRDGELIDRFGGGGVTDRATAGACAFAHRSTAEQAMTVLDLLAADVPRQPNQFRDSDDAHAATCIDIATTHPQLAVPALTRLFDLASHDARKAVALTADDRVLDLIKGNVGSSGPSLPLLTTEQRDVLRTAALRLADGQSPITQALRHELAPHEPAALEAAHRAADRILTRPDPQAGQTAFGSLIVTDAYLASLLDQPERTACLEKLLSIAEDAREAAMNRQNALDAAANLVLHAEPAVRAAVFQRSKHFVTGAQDGSAHDDEMTGPAHPLSFLRISMGTATLRGQGLRLAGCASSDDAERRWVRDRAVDLLRSGEDSLIQQAALALAAMDSVTTELDADLLAAHHHVNVRQLSAHLCVRQPERYRVAALRLAEDRNPRVRRVLAEAAARAYAQNPEGLREIVGVLASDARHSIRTAARPSAGVDQVSSAATADP